MSGTMEQHLWSVLEEHFAEVEFLAEQWTLATTSPLYNLKSLSSRLENRLVAHLDGLAIGGLLVAERLLWPALVSDDAESSHRRAAGLSLVWLSQNGFPELLKQLLGSPSKQVQDLLRCVAWIAGLSWPANNTDEARERQTVAGLRDLQDLSARRSQQSLLMDLLRAEEPSLRWEAAKTAMVWQRKEGWHACQRLASQGHSEAVLVLGMLGGGQELTFFQKLLDSPSTAAMGLWALGFSGRVEAASLCVQLLSSEDDDLAKLAFEAFAHITGISIDSPAFQRAPVEEDDADAMLSPLDGDLGRNLEFDVLQMLPLPSAPDLVQWWKDHQGKFDKTRRYILGEVMTEQSVQLALNEAPLRWRSALGFEIEVRSRGRVRPSEPRLGMSRSLDLTGVDFQQAPVFK